MVQLQRQMKNIEETQNMSKPHSVFFFNDLLFLKLIFSFFKLSIISSLKCYGCANLGFTLNIWAPKLKEQHVKNHEKNECVESYSVN